MVEIAFSQSEAQLRLMTNSLPVLIAYLDADLRYVMINKTGAEWYGRPAAEIIGERGEDIFGAQHEKWRSQGKETLLGVKTTDERTVS